MLCPLCIADIQLFLDNSQAEMATHTSMPPAPRTVIIWLLITLDASMLPRLPVVSAKVDTHDASSALEECSAFNARLCRTTNSYFKSIHCRDMAILQTACDHLLRARDDRLNRRVLNQFPSDGLHCRLSLDMSICSYVSATDMETFPWKERFSSPISASEREES